jgi:hypothetical protein
MLTILLDYDAFVVCDSGEDLNSCRSKTVSSDTDRHRHGSDFMAKEICNYYGIYSCSIMQDFYGPHRWVCDYSFFSLVWMCTISLHIYFTQMAYYN